MRRSAGRIVEPTFNGILKPIGIIENCHRFADRRSLHFVLIRLTARASYPAGQQQDYQYDKQKPETAAGIVAPATAVGPSRQCADQQQDQND